MAACLILPWPVTLIPKTGWLSDGWNTMWSWGVGWLAETAFGLPAPPSVFNGSGDRMFDYLQLLLFAIAAVLGTVVWSILDRRRTSYPRLAAAVHVLLRYSLANAMLTYGFAKIVKGQFPDLWPGRLVGTVGDMSPMGLLWTFMGYSTPYTVFAGLLEAIGGVLLLWRLTTTIGALLATTVMFNVAMLNLCYDVPVKLYSIELLIIALVIAAPRAKALIRAMLGRSAPEAPARTRMSPRWERARLVVKLGVLGMFAWNLHEFVEQPSRNRRVHELQDAWLVDSFTLDGVERTLATDPERWHKLGFNPNSLWLFPMVGYREGLTLKVDSDNREITVDLNDRIRDQDRPKNKDGKTDQETWKYHRPTPDHLEIDGVHRGKRFHVAAHLLPYPLLITRGFRWINDSPFNR